MSGELQPYPAYKDSGVPWLGEVPAQIRADILALEQETEGLLDEILV